MILNCHIIFPCVILYDFKKVLGSSGEKKRITQETPADLDKSDSENSANEYKNLETDKRELFRAIVSSAEDKRIEEAAEKRKYVNINRTVPWRFPEAIVQDIIANGIETNLLLTILKHIFVIIKNEYEKDGMLKSLLFCILQGEEFHTIVNRMKNVNFDFSQQSDKEGSGEKPPDKNTENYNTKSFYFKINCEDEVESLVEKIVCKYILEIMDNFCICDEPLLKISYHLKLNKIGFANDLVLDSNVHALIEELIENILFQTITDKYCVYKQNYLKKPKNELLPRLPVNRKQEANEGPIYESFQERFYVEESDNHDCKETSRNKEHEYNKLREEIKSYLNKTKNDSEKSKEIKIKQESIPGSLTIEITQLTKHKMLRKNDPPICRHVEHNCRVCKFLEFMTEEFKTVFYCMIDTVTEIIKEKNNDFMHLEKDFFVNFFERKLYSEYGPDFCKAAKYLGEFEIKSSDEYEKYIKIFVEEMKNAVEYSRSREKLILFNQ